MKIEVLGQPFTFKTDSDVVAAEGVADYFKSEINKVESKLTHHSPRPDKRALLILTALNITNDYLELKSKHQELLENIESRAASLIQSLETRLQ